MALVVKDRVKEVTTTVGTSDFTLGGAVLGYQSFSVIGNTNQTYYSCADPSTGDWEVGIGTYSTTGPTLTRDTVLESSNSGSKVSFAAGSKDIFCTYPAERSVYLDTAGSAVTVLDVGTLGTSTANITTANITSGTVSTTPTSSTDIANKTYVDNLVASGTSYHTPVKYEVPNTTGNLTALYNNGTGGVGATLTNNGTLAAFAPDGPTASPGDRILVYNQTNAYENGVYTVTTVGSGSVAWVLTRATDADSYGVKDPDALGNGDAFFVTSGNTGAGETYICNTVGTITFGTTAITFAQISSAQVYTAGTGISFSPSTTINIANTGVAATTYGSASQVPVFAVNAQGQLTSVTNTSIAIAAGAVSGLAASATTDTTNASNISSGTLPTGRITGSYTGITGVGTLTAGTWNANTIGVTYGGTGFSSYTVGDLLYADTSSTLAKLADVAYGSVLLSGGVGTAPSYGKVSLTAHVTGTLAVASGGTGATTLTGYVYGNGTGAMTASTSIPNSATTATSANTASAIVARDASGNFSAGTITASLSGNASTATSATSATTATTATSASTSTTQPKSDASTNIATTAFSKQLFYSPSTAGTLDWNDVSNTRPGAGATLLLGSATNGPGGGNYYIPFNYEYASFDGTGNVTQTAIAYGTPGNELWMRGRYSGSWSSWVRFLNNNNYNSYSPTLTGGGASGTWSINITGSAGSAGSVDYNNLTNKTGGTGTYTTSGDYRAPIFYDSNDTGYYIDPASTSNLNRLVIQPRIDNYYVGNVSGTDPVADWQSLTNATGQFIVSQFNNTSLYTNSPPSVYTYGAVMSWRTANHSFQLYASHTGDITYKTQWNNDNYSGWLYPMVYGRTNGAGGSIYGTIFYDQNNTGYYVDPASTSRMNNINYDNLYFASDTTYGLIGRNGYLDTVNGRGSDALELNYYDGGPVKIGSGTYGSKDLYAAALYGTIFYDSNNTGYYVDPASTSYLNNVQATDWFRPVGDTGVYWQSYGVGLWAPQSGGNSYGNVMTYAVGRNGWTGYGLGSRITLMTDTNNGGSTTGLHDSAVGWYWRYVYDSYFSVDRGYSTFANSARAPIFYDSDNTGYYADFSSTAGDCARFAGGIHVSVGNVSGNGIILADDGDIVDLNDGYCSMRFSYGVRVFSANRGGSAQVALTYQGNVIAAGNVTAYGSPSDRRLKENIQPLTDALDKVMQLQGCTFNWKEDSEQHTMVGMREDIGFIADDVQAIIPKMVREGADGYLSLRDRGFSALLVEAMKEQQAQIAALRTELKALQTK